MSNDDFARLIYLGLLVAALLGWLLVEFRRSGNRSVQSALAWGLIVLGLMAGYGLWTDIRRDILPEQQVQDGSVVLPRAADGHYYANLAIGGQTVRFMADTGASSVVLSQSDARRLGIDLGKLVYLGQAMTANGPVRTATVTLRDVALGPFRDAAIKAQVNEGEMEQSLLGMDYLGLYAVTIANDEMMLKR